MGILKLCVTVTDKKKRVSVESYHQNEGRSKSLTFKTTSDVCLNTDPWRMIFHPCCSFTLHLTVVLLLSGGSGVLPTLIDRLFFFFLNCISIVNENSLIQSGLSLRQCRSKATLCSDSPSCLPLPALRLSLRPLLVLKGPPASIKKSIML